MNDFKGFDWNDPGLRAPSAEEREERAASREAGLEPPFPPVQSTSPVPFEPPAPAPRPLIPGSPLPLGVGILGNKSIEAEWERLAPPPQRPVAAEPAEPAPAAPAPTATAPELAAADEPPALASPPPVPTAPAPPRAMPSAPAPVPVPRGNAPKPLASPAPSSPVSLSPLPRTQPPSNFQRAVNVFRAAMPLVQRVLPLLDGNVGAAVSNLMAPRPQTAPPQPQVNLVPLEAGLTRLQLQHRELRDQIVEQNASLKKVDDQLQQVREATDRNTLEQQELLQDLKSVGTRVNVFAYIALALLGLSVLLNVFLFFEVRRFLH